MIKLISVILIAVCLTSCFLFRDADDNSITLPPLEKNTADVPENTQSPQKQTSHNETTEPIPDETADKALTETEADTSPKPVCIGMYDEVYSAGTYNRMYSLSSPMPVGVDIAVFDILLSAEETLYGTSYRELWSYAASNVTLYPASKPYITLEYTLSDGTVKKSEIRTPSDAEAVISEGYIEVYLYDDVHQTDGAWYSHLTPADVTEETVISSVKLTAGKLCDSVSSITVSACLDGSAAASVMITR